VASSLWHVFILLWYPPPTVCFFRFWCLIFYSSHQSL
jgi:hypothetical protein